MNVASMASITAIVELIAYAYKTKTSADNKWIPVICMVLASLLGLFTLRFILQLMRLPRVQWELALVRQQLHCMRAFSSPLINNRGV